jgi:putative thioredoxin
MSANTPSIVEANPETFQRDVIERSSDLPVVVDFWAAWCQPCRLLTPVLEKLADEYEGRFLLVKADTERVPEIAGGFGVQSIPAVFGLRDGQVVDSFVGVLPETAIRAWIDRLLPTPAEALVAEAIRLEGPDPEAAEARLREAMALAPHEPGARIVLARVLAARGQSDEARALIDGLQRRGFLEPEAERLKAELDLQAGARHSGGVEACRAAVAAHPDDRALRLTLAEALAAAGSFPEALDLCLDLIERDRKGLGEAARKVMVRIFQMLPADSEMVAEYRRKLSTALY